MKQSELTSEKIQEFVDEHSDKIDGNAVKVGIYKFPNSDNVSIDLNIVAPTSMRDEAIAFGRDAGQESLFDLDTFENVKTGADGKNPKSFTSEEFKEIARKFSRNEPNQTTTTTEEVTVPNQEGKNTGNDEVLRTSITKENFEGLNLSETLGLNTLSNVLEDWDNKLKDFSKDTLGVNLPVVVARGAIKAMKAAVSVSKTGADVLSAGINYVRNTDWYKNLNDSDKKDFESKGILSYLTEIENKKEALESTLSNQTDALSRENIQHHLEALADKKELMLQKLEYVKKDEFSAAKRERIKRQLAELEFKRCRLRMNNKDCSKLDKKIQEKQRRFRNDI